MTNPYLPYEAEVIERIQELYAQKRPLLVGTCSVAESEQVSGWMQEQDIPHQVLNAKQHEREAQTVAEAGRHGLELPAHTRRPQPPVPPSGEVLHEAAQIVVVEHNTDLIRGADWVIDLGPEGGDGGGEVIAAGTPEDVAACARSFTGQYLKPLLREDRARRSA
mgnify:CR=1 FL=1